MADENTRPISLFATGLTGPYGKYLHEVKTLLDEHTYNEWLRYCASKDIKSSELMRDILYMFLHQHTPSEIVAKDRRAIVDERGLNAAITRLKDPGEARAA